MSIEAVYIITQKLDLRLTRICVASIRFWYPEMPIYLIKDEMLAPFDTREIERLWNVKVEKCGRVRLGGGRWLIKFEPFFLEQRRRVMILDSDIALCGPILETLDQVDADFVVAEEYWHGPLDTPYGHTVLKELFFDVHKLREFDPLYEFSGKAFNSGQMIITTGLLKRDDFDALIDWRGLPRLKRTDIFKFGDQGVLNYMLHQKSREGKLRLKYADFLLFQGDPRCKAIDVRRIQGGEGSPFLIHWAGSRPAILSRMTASQVLYFFEDYYYSRHPRCWVKRRWRACEYALARGQRSFVSRMRGVFRQFLAGLGLLEIVKKMLRRTA